MAPLNRGPMAGGPRTVADVGEDLLIERIAGRLGTPPGDEKWAGDDAAVIRLPEGAALFTTDVLVEGLDFEWSWCSGADVGWKSVASNASDVAAMGGRPRHAVVALSLPAEASVELVDAIVDGMVAAAASCGAAVVGGDLSGGRNVSIAVAMVGTCDRSVGRSGASVGEAICVTGQLGGAAGGLRALRAGLVVGDGPPALQRLASRQLRPRARVDEGVALARIGAAAMIDVSDGLLLDLTRMARASGRGFAVDPETVPVDPDLAALKELSPEEVLALASTGGEDFELLFTIEAERVAAARAELASLNTPVTQIGVVTEGGRRFGQEDAEDLGELGWQHLRNP